MLLVSVLVTFNMGRIFVFRNLIQETIFIIYFLLTLLATLITNNLDIYSQFLRTRASRFTIKALLHLNEVILEPDAATIMNGTIRVIRNMLDGTKMFVRFYRYVMCDSNISSFGGH